MSKVIIPGRFGIGQRVSPYVSTDYYHTTFRNGVRIAEGNRFELLPEEK